MTNLIRTKESEKLCLDLLRAETEDEVLGILQSASLWDDECLWQDYGGMDMNRSIVGNQQSSPVAALVEKIVNSLDAVLIAECLRIGIDPCGPKAPQTMQQAVKEFFDVHEGRIPNLTPGERTEIAKRIQLVATGSKKNPNFMVIDEGEGQYPKNFPNTFLSLLRKNKTGISFVQGKFNMGGTGVLQFAGRYSFQLIVSRRRSDLVLLTNQDEEYLWGFTLIRRLDPGNARPYSRYVYLAPQGKIPTFSADSIPVRPGSYPNAYSEPLMAGTVLKLWNYKVPGRLKTNLMFDMRRALEKHLPEPCLPIRLYERRPGYRAHSYETTLSGLSCVIRDNPDDIECGLDTGTPLAVSGVGKVHMKVTVVKEETIRGRNPKYPRGGVFFIVNGQLHSELDKGFIERRTKLDYIAGTTLAIVDCSKLGERVREDLFLGSRDRMRECDERDLLYSAIADYIKNHPGLRELNARRRQERLAAAISEEETAKIIQEIVRTDPSLADLFGKGKKIKVPRGPELEREPYVGRQFPTYFRLAKEPKGGLIKRCPRNWRTRVKFETDATNDYFSRSKDPGRIDVGGSPSLASIHLWDGLATLTFELPERCSPGDTLNVSVSVMDISRVEPFTSSFRIEVEADAKPGLPGPPKPVSGSAFTGLPNITEVRRHEWEKWGFDERSALALRSSGNEDGEELDIAINMDNLYLQNERARRRKMDPELLNYWFKYGLCLLALGILYEKRRTGEPRDEVTPEVETAGGRFQDVEEACRGLAVTIIPVVSQLSKGKLTMEK
ncbi:MAG: hypothetical protein JRJ69_11310 [Deltaproteobacteria bacterium]|nr:hypothetical protein [Deltaproteobacteria bacterium]